MSYFSRIFIRQSSSSSINRESRFKWIDMKQWFSPCSFQFKSNEYDMFRYLSYIWNDLRECACREPIVVNWVNERLCCSLLYRTVSFSFLQFATHTNSISFVSLRICPWLFVIRNKWCIYDLLNRKYPQTSNKWTTLDRFKHFKVHLAKTL